MLELQSRVLDVKFNGEVHKVKFPTVDDFKEYQGKFAEKENSLEVISNFLSKLGLNANVIRLMEPAHLEQIVSAITEVKKNPKK